MSLFSRLVSGIGRRLPATIAGFAAGGPAGAALGLAAGGGVFGLGGGGGGGGGGLGGALGGLGAGYDIGQGIGQVLGQRARSRGQLQLTPGFQLDTVPSHNVGVYPMAGGGGGGASSMVVYQGGRPRFTRQSAIEYFNSTGMVPPGYHHTTGARAMYSIAKNRRMNVLNPRALGRAMRRARGFARYASKVVSFVKHGAHGAKFKHHRRKRA